MTDKDNITLPREVVQEALEALAKTPCNSVYEQDCTPCNAEEALRKALAAEQPKHPGYVIGSHWLETAYSRVCAGEAEADVLRDCGWERVDEALRRDAERYRWLTKDDTKYETRRRVRNILSLFNAYAYRKEHIDAAIDAAMKEGT